ncbi:MAG: sigma 54-interacting transcriptional regulator [Lautropia sp.]|nr:sigma 54-interacting transcriptional regulator [Lautropia sp.]
MPPINKAWESFVCDGTLPDQEVRPLVAQSWERSARLQIGADRLAAPLIEAGELHRRRLESAGLLAAAAPVLARSRLALAKARSMLILTDVDGLIVAAEGDPRVLDHGRETNLLPGGRWHEAHMGTNAIGTALAERRAVQIHGSEHYCAGAQRWTCAAAPIIHPANGRMLGVLDISGQAHAFNPQSMALALALGSEIERELDRRLRVEHERLLRHFMGLRIDGMRQDTLVLDRHGAVVHTTRDVGQRGPWEDSGLHALLSQAPMQAWAHTLQRREPGADIELVRHENEDIGAVVFLPRATLKGKTQVRSRQPAGGPASGRGRPASDALHVCAAILGESPALVRAREQLLNLASAGLPLLIEGETGTGKELFARAFGEQSRGSRAPFVPVNCGGMARELIASELFGYARGSFTGADERGRSGRIVAADGGTLCLDEIGEMPMELQPYLLRVLEDGVVYPVGSQNGQRVDISLVSMTNRSLRDEVGNGHFRGDLYYRIAAATIVIPPLRVRGDDIVLLAEHHARRAAERLQRPAPRFSSEVLDILRAYDWPGNVRQLRNVVEMLVVLAADGVIEAAQLPAEVCQGASGADGSGGTGVITAGVPVGVVPVAGVIAGSALAAASGAGGGVIPGGPLASAQPGVMADGRAAAARMDEAGTLRQQERQAIEEAIAAARGNMAQAARRLGIARSTLYARLNAHGIVR